MSVCPGTARPDRPVCVSIARAGIRSSSPPRERPGMIVRRTAVVAGALLLGVTCVRGASQVEADPHELYERARGYLADGELRGAGLVLSRLRTLIAKGPEWDPEGVFAKELLPPLQSRLNRLQAVAHKLDDFTVKALQDLQPPDIKKDISTVRDYTEWATSVIQRLRAERDQLIGAELADSEERAFLTHTESYERTERLLEIDVLKRMADTAGDDILGLLAGDPELESVLVRFRQLKRDLMQIMAERDQLDADVKKSHEHSEAVLGVLAAVVTDDPSLKTHAAGKRPVNVSDLFARPVSVRIRRQESRRLPRRWTGFPCRRGSWAPSRPPVRRPLCSWARWSS